MQKTSCCIPGKSSRLRFHLSGPCYGSLHWQPLWEVSDVTHSQWSPAMVEYQHPIPQALPGICMSNRYHVYIIDMDVFAQLFHTELYWSCHVAQVSRILLKQTQRQSRTERDLQLSFCLFCPQTCQQVVQSIIFCINAAVIFKPG